MKTKNIVLSLTVLVVFFFLSLSAAFAKYCPQCGENNNNSNAYCVKCGAQFSKMAKKTNVGVMLVSSIHPGDDARFTIYYKTEVTPFLVWNTEGKTEIGETKLPVMEDMTFVPMHEKKVPSAGDIKALGKKYKVSKFIVYNYNAKATERVPIFSSQSYEIFLDVMTFDVNKGTVIKEKRYKESLKSWPDITVPQVKTAVTKLWEEMLPNIRILLTN